MKKISLGGVALFALSAPYMLKTRVNETISMKSLILSMNRNRW